MATESSQSVSQIVTFRQKLHEDIRLWAQALKEVKVNIMVICGAPSCLEDVIQNRTPTNAACVEFESLRKTMNEAKHSVFRGYVYRRTPGGKSTLIFTL